MSEIDSDRLMRRAEHEINYRARRAIEMFLPVWKKDLSFAMFHVCANSHCLCQGEIEKCKALMEESGMTE